MIRFLRWLFGPAPIHPRILRARSLARFFNFELLEFPEKKFALSCGIVRFPLEGQADLGQVEEMLFKMKMGHFKKEKGFGHD